MKRKYLFCIAVLITLTLCGCSKNYDQMKNISAEQAKQPNNNAAEQTSEEPASVSDKNALDSRISAETAEDAALSHAGLSKDQVTIVKNALETEHGREIYEIEFYSSDHTEYDYEIDADSGEVLTYSRDLKDTNSHASTEGSGTDSTTITPEKAKELALAQVPGASETDIWEFETDYDDGHTEYEGKIIYNGMEYEFEIDASSGAFRSWETEPVD